MLQFWNDATMVIRIGWGHTSVNSFMSIRLVDALFFCQKFFKNTMKDPKELIIDYGMFSTLS